MTRSIPAWLPNRSLSQDLNGDNSKRHSQNVCDGGYWEFLPALDLQLFAPACG
jgi:hypothetical protein